MKNILHFKFDINNRNLNPELVGKFLKLYKDFFGDEFYVVASPFDPSLAKIKGNDLKLYNFELNEISIDELKKLIEQ